MVSKKRVFHLTKRLIKLISDPVNLIHTYIVEDGNPSYKKAILVTIIKLAVPYWRPSVDVEPGLVLRVECPEYLGELAADLVVVLRQVVQAPVSQL